MEKFVYAFNEADRDYLIQQGFVLLTSDEVHHRYMFENKPRHIFSSDETDNRQLIFSNKMTF